MLPSHLLFCLYTVIMRAASVVLAGSSVCATEQRGERLQSRAHHIPGPGGPLWVHPGPPQTDAARHDRPGEERRSGGSVRSLLAMQNCFCLICICSSFLMLCLMLAYFLLISLMLMNYYQSYK